MTPIKDRYRTDNQKIVIFGAGKIGRSFIGQLFSRAGYEVVFLDINNNLIVSTKGFKNTIPGVTDLDPKDNIKAWVDCKIFIHNLGHATAAYLGYGKYPEAVFIYEVLDDPKILRITRDTMLQSACILKSLYPDEFRGSQLEGHIDDLLNRFRNRALGDTIFRVGCDLYRKLGPDDRLTTPIKAAITLNKPYDLILNALLAAISFRAKDGNGNYFPADENFFSEAQLGQSYILRNVCRLDLMI